MFAVSVAVLCEINGITVMDGVTIVIALSFLVFGLKFNCH